MFILIFYVIHHTEIARIIKTDSHMYKMNRIEAGGAAVRRGDDMCCALFCVYLTYNVCLFLI